MEGFKDPFAEKRHPSKGEKEVEAGEYLLDFLRLLGVAFPKGREDEDAVRRTGVLLRRRFWRK